MTTLIGLSIIAVFAMSIVFGVRATLILRKLRQRFSAVVEIDAEVEKVQLALDQLLKEQAKCSSKHKEELASLNSKYISAKEVFDRLNQQVSLLEENLEDISFGVYKPHFSFQTSQEYKAKCEELRARRKTLIKANKATKCFVEWNVSGSKKEGARMTKQYTKLMLRAFNGETDSAIAKVSWNNITKMEERIRKAWDAINTLGSTMKMSITPEYLEVCLNELRLEFELENKIHQEQEEQRKIRERLREEEKAQREYDKAQREAETDEARYLKALEKARAEVSFTTGNELAELNEKIGLLEQRAKEAEEAKKRAISMAQQTRCGYIYVISNVGTMGEEILKIGMTRRLDPMDRVRELSDASVPFGFDVHTMVYSEDAPTLEAEIHAKFAEQRVNLVNQRREFFKVPLQEVADFIGKKNLKIELSTNAEAREYRETMALIKKRIEQSNAVATSSPFPESLVLAAADAGEEPLVVSCNDMRFDA